MPMGFCFPGKGTSGDLPPRPECAPRWHKQVFSGMKKVKLTILIGQYSQKYYLVTP
jgi:uracil-DNA glycosylase